LSRDSCIVSESWRLRHEPEVYNEEVVSRFYRSLDCFAVDTIEPSKALQLCNEWYADIDLIECKEITFELDEDEFTLIDNRNKEMY
jgi:hypothetical protein